MTTNTTYTVTIKDSSGQVTDYVPNLTEDQVDAIRKALNFLDDPK